MIYRKNPLIVNILVPIERWLKSRARSLVLLVIIAALPAFANAEATFFISPSTGSHKVGDEFSVLIDINTDGQAINAGAAEINFDKTRINVVSLGYSKSIFTLWPKLPSFDNDAGSISLTGGLPSPGFTGTEGAVLRVTFKAIAGGSAKVDFVNGSLLVNGGDGNNIVGSMKGADFSIVGGAAPAPEVEKQTEPEPPAPPVPVQPATLQPPVLTEWPTTLETGTPLIIKGKAASSSKIILNIAKDGQLPTEDETYSFPDGAFSYVMTNPKEPGAYQVTAQVVSADGRKSAISSAVNVEVTAPAAAAPNPTCVGNDCSGGTGGSNLLIYVLLALVFAVSLGAVAYLWTKTVKLEKYQREDEKKIGGVESEVGGVVEDFKQLETSDQTYRTEVSSEIDKINELKEDITRQIADLKKMVEGNGWKPEATNVSNKQERFVEPAEIKPLKPADALGKTTPDKLRSVATPAYQPLSASTPKTDSAVDILGLSRSKKEEPIVATEQASWPTPPPPVTLKTSEEEIPVYNPFESMTSPKSPTIDDSEPALEAEETAPSPIAEETKAALPQEDQAKDLPKEAISYQAPVPKPAQPLKEIKPQFEQTVKGTPFTRSEIGVQALKEINFDAKKAVSNTVPSAPAVPVVPSPGARPDASQIAVPKPPEKGIPGRPLFTTPGFAGSSSTGPLKAGPVHLSPRPIPPKWQTPTPQKWPPQDYTGKVPPRV